MSEDNLAKQYYYFDGSPQISNFAEPDHFELPNSLPIEDVNRSIQRQFSRSALGIQFFGAAIIPKVKEVIARARIDGFFVFSILWEQPPQTSHDLQLCVRLVSHAIKECLDHTHISNAGRKINVRNFKNTISVKPIELDEENLGSNCEANEEKEEEGNPLECKCKNAQDALKKLDDDVLASLACSVGSSENRRKLRAILFLRAQFMYSFERANKFRARIDERFHYLPLVLSFLLFLVTSVLGFYSSIDAAESSIDPTLINYTFDRYNFYKTLVYNVFLASLMFLVTYYLIHRYKSLVLRYARSYLHYGGALNSAVREIMHGRISSLDKREPAKSTDDFERGIEIMRDQKRADNRSLAVVGVCVGIVALISQRVVFNLTEQKNSGEFNTEVSFSDFMELMISVVTQW